MKMDRELYIDRMAIQRGTLPLLWEAFRVDLLCKQFLNIYIGVGRCSDLGGRHFFKQQKCDFLEEQCLHAIWSTILH